MSAPVTATQPKPSVDAVIDAVAAVYSVPRAVLVARGQKRNDSVIRHMGMFAARYLTDATLKEIGCAFGGRDFSTVIYGIQQADFRMSLDRDLRNDYAAIRRQVGA